MKIAQFTPTFLPQIGGIEIVVHNLALQQQANGHDVTIITNYHGWKHHKDSFPYQILPLWPRAIQQGRNSSWGRWLVAQFLKGYQQLFQFDIWHLHSAYAGAYLAKSAMESISVPSLITCHGADIQTLPSINYGFRLKPEVGEAKIRDVLTSSDAVVALSHSMYELLQELGVPSSRIVSIPNGVHVDMITQHQRQKQQIRQALGWPADKFVILTVGRNHRKKGYRFIPEIIQHLQIKLPEFLWFVVGGGTESLQKQAEEMALTPWLQVRSAIGAKGDKPTDYKFPTSDLIDLYKAADLFVFPSLIESFGVVLIEAMAAGLPVVTTAVPGCQDVIQHGKNGLLAPAGDPLALAELIMQLHDNQALYQHIQQTAYEAVKQYDWPIVSKQYEQAYAQLITKGKNAP